MTPALILIDIQQAFDDHDCWGGERNNPAMETHAAHLLAHWRQMGAPVVVVQHASVVPGSPLAAHQPGFAFKAGFAPREGEKHIVKHQNSAFIGTDLETWLRGKGIDKVILCGISTEHCVSTTVRMAANLGFAVDLVSDACHAWAKADPVRGTPISAETVHETEIAILSGEFAQIVSSAQAIAQLETPI